MTGDGVERGGACSEHIAPLSRRHALTLHRTMLTLACSSKTATLSTVRYVSPRGMPLFSFAIPVRTVLHFGGPSKSLQVTHIAEEWPLDAFLQRTPVVGTL